MFCTNCGKNLEEGGAFCPNCGAAVAQTPQTSESPVEEASVQVTEPVAEVQAPAEEKPVAEAQPEAAEEPVAQASAAEEAGGEAPAEEVAFESPAQPDVPKDSIFKKIGRGLYKARWLLGVGVPVLAVAAFVFFNWNWLSGMAVKTFGTPAEYFAYAENASLKDSVADFSTLYGNLAGSMQSAQGGGMRGEVTMTVGAYLRTMLASSGMDMSWLDEVSVGMEAVADKDGNGEYSVDLAISDEEIVRLHIVADEEGQAVYVGLPGLHSDYVKLDLSAMEVDEETMAQLEVYMGALQEAMQAIPSEEAMNDLLNRYLDIIISNIDNAEQKSTELTVKGVTQSVTEVVVELDTRTVAKILKAVLVEARNDQTIKDVLVAVSDLAVMEGGQDVDVVAMYEKAIDDLLAQYQDIPDEANTVLCVLHDYIDGSHSVVGRKIVVGEEAVFYYASVEDGGDMALTVEVNGEPVFAGKGTKSGDAVTGTFEIIDNGNSVFSFDVKDLDLSRLADGYAEGQIRFTLPVEGAAMRSSSTVLQLSFDIEPDQVVYTVAMYMGASELISIRAEMEEIDGRTVTIPSQSVTVSDEQGLTQWANGLDSEELLKRLKDAGLEELINQLMGGMSDEF